MVMMGIAFGNVAIFPEVLLSVNLINLGLMVASGDRQGLKMVSSLILSTLEIVHRIVKKRVLTLYTAVGVVEARDAHGLLTRVLGVLGSHHMDLSSHLNTVVQGIDGVSSMVLAAMALKFALVD